MKTYIYILLLFNSLSCLAQDNLIDTHFSEADSLYREDQFYVGLGINFLMQRPKGVRQSGFSGGFHLGFIRDMPINTQRNLAIGLGLGLSVNTYSQNLLIAKDDSGQTVFDVIDSSVNYSENRFSTHVVELPLHFRWRTSDVGNKSSFWRVYAGINFGYMYYFRSVFRQQDLSIEETQFDELNRLRYAFYFAFGKSKINFFFRYSLNPLFNGKVQETNEAVRINEIKAGLVFYLL